MNREQISIRDMKKAFIIYVFATLFLVSDCADIFKNEQSNSGELIWIAQANAPAQCQPLIFTSLEDAVKSLKKSGIGVFDSADNLGGEPIYVCASCSCPTGVMYYAQILQSDLAKASKKGWFKLTEYRID